MIFSLCGDEKFKAPDIFVKKDSSMLFYLIERGSRKMLVSLESANQELLDIFHLFFSNSRRKTLISEAKDVSGKYFHLYSRTFLEDGQRTEEFHLFFDDVSDHPQRQWGNQIPGLNTYQKTFFWELYMRGPISQIVKLSPQEMNVPVPSPFLTQQSSYRKEPVHSSTKKQDYLPYGDTLSMLTLRSPDQRRVVRIRPRA